GIALVFARVPEQVALVVMLQAAIGRGEQQAVVHLVPAVACAQLHAAADRRVEVASLVPDPGHGRPVHGLGLADGIVAETAGEGLRQQHQVGDAAQRSDQPAVVLPVAGGVVPAGIALYEADSQVLHGTPTIAAAGSWPRRGWPRSWRSIAGPGAGPPAGWH